MLCITDKLRGKFVDDDPFLFNLWWESHQEKSIWIKNNKLLIDGVIYQRTRQQSSVSVTPSVVPNQSVKV